MAQKEQLKKPDNLLAIVTGLIPLFLLLFIIGLIKADTMVLHQKVFKTLLIYISCIGMFFYYYWFTFKEKSIRVHMVSLFFACYFFFILFQYIVSFLSGEVSYDRNYYLANYGFLIILALFTYLFLHTENDLNRWMKLLAVFLIILFSIGIYDFTEYVLYPPRIGSLYFETLIIDKLDASDAKNMKLLYRESNDIYYRTPTMTSENKAYLKEILSKTDFYKHLNPGSLLSGFRPQISFGNANYFAAYVVCLLPLALLSIIALYDRKLPFFKNYFSILAVLGFIGGSISVLLTQTTSSFLGIYVAILLIAILSIISVTRLRWYWKVLTIAGILAVLVILPFYLLFYANGFVGMFLPRLVTKLSSLTFFINDRLNGWIIGFKLFLKHPLTGAGLGTIYPGSFQYVPKYFFLYSDSNSFKHAHNEFVEILGEAGIVGILVFFAMIGFVLYKMVRIFFNKTHTRTVRLTALGTGGGILAILVQQVFDLSLRMSVSMAAYFTLLGLAIFLIVYTEHSQNTLLAKPIQINKYLFFTVALVLLLTGGVLFRPLFLAEHNVMKSSKYPEQREKYLDLAVYYMKGNPYVWTQRYSYHSTMLENLVKQYQDDTKNRDELEQNIEHYYAETINDLLCTNTIIEGYQDLWNKHADTLYEYNLYLSKKMELTGDNSLSTQIFANERSVLTDMERSLSNNYLNYNNRILKLSLLTRLDMQDQIPDEIKAVVETRILLDYSREKHIVKENIHINFDAEKNNAEYTPPAYTFTISKQMVDELTELVRSADGNTSIINRAVQNSITKLYALLSVKR